MGCFIPVVYNNATYCNKHKTVNQLKLQSVIVFGKGPLFPAFLKFNFRPDMDAKYLGISHDS